MDSGSRRLEGKVILVTGSGRGFGRSVAIAYAMEGARVISVARTLSELDYTANVIQARGGEVLTIPADLSRVEEIFRLRDEVLKTYDRLDVLFNNAATSPWKTIDEMTVEDWDRTIAVNLRAPFLLTKAFLETMKSLGGGSVVNVTSASAERGFVAELAYSDRRRGQGHARRGQGAIRRRRLDGGGLQGRLGLRGPAARIRRHGTEIEHPKAGGGTQEGRLGCRDREA